MTWTISIPGAPVGKGRPRCSCVGGRPRLRTPENTRAWEKAAALLMRCSWRESPLAAPCRVEVTAVHPRPASRPRTISATAWRSGERVWRPSTPDADNVLKAVLDALQLGGVLEDDRWVVEVEARTVYAARGEEASVEVVVLEMEVMG